MKSLQVQEAFRSGKANEVIHKLGRVLSRKIGKTLKFATVPITYINDYGTFKGFLGSMDKGLYIKINFLLTNSDSIFSYDIYHGKPIKPEYTVDTEGLNIIQIIDSIVSNLAEDGFIELQENAPKIRGPYIKNIREKRGRPSVGSIENFLPGFERWFDSDPSLIDVFEKESFTKLYSRYFLKWAADKPRYKEIKYYLFNKIMKRFLLEKGIQNKTLKPRKKGSKERQVEDPIMQSQMQDVVDSMSWKKKFNKLEKMIRAMTRDMIQSVYLYGTPGSGKSKTVIDTLNAEGVEYKVYKGGVSGTDELVQILYNNRDNMIMVFDDFDSVRRNKDQVNILKSALENQPVREITWAKVPKRGFNYEPKFDFTSGIIFISNETKLDSALASRSINIEISLDSEQMIDKMEQTLKEFRPDVDMKIKKQALEFAEEVAGGVAGGIDYRILESIIVAIQIDPSDWKDTAYVLLTSIPS